MPENESDKESNSAPAVPLTTQELAHQLMAARVRIVAWIGVFVRDPHLAEDVFQDCMAEAIANLARFDASRPLLPWVMGIARNCALRTLRERGRQPVQQGPELLATLEAVHQDADEQDEELLRQLPALRVCLQAMKPKPRELLQRRFWQGESLAAIATALESSAEAIQMRLARLRAKLAACMRKQGASS